MEEPMLIAVDLSRLYFSVRDLKLRLDYEKLFNLLSRTHPQEDLEIHAFTVASPENKKQAAFLSKLVAIGVNVHSHPKDTRASFSEELSAVGLEYLALGRGDVLFVSNDRALIRVFDLFQEKYHQQMGICFFSDKLEGKWPTKILRDKTPFVDLSAPDTLRGLLLQEKTLDPQSQK